MMALVKGKDTSPEKKVRSIVHRMGYRFRLHRKDLPGKPDIVLPRHKKVIFVHGCFWHGHEGCPRSHRPTTNTEFWDSKLDHNMKRDRSNQKRLKEMGWNVLVVWECQLKNIERVIATIERFIKNNA
jgi:DNA mismatch endonuclease, patch repair protein